MFKVVSTFEVPILSMGPRFTEDVSLCGAVAGLLVQRYMMTWLPKVLPLVVEQYYKGCCCCLYPILLIHSWFIVPYACILCPGQCVVLSYPLVVSGVSCSLLMPPVLFSLCSMFLFSPLVSALLLSSPFLCLTLLRWANVGLYIGYVHCEISWDDIIFEPVIGSG